MHCNYLGKQRPIISQSFENVCVYLLVFQQQTDPNFCMMNSNREMDACGPEIWEMIHHDASRRIQQLDCDVATCGCNSLCERWIHQEHAQRRNMLSHIMFKWYRHRSGTAVADSIIIIIIITSIIMATIKPSVALFHVLVSKASKIHYCQYILSFIAINN